MNGWRPVSRTRSGWRGTQSSGVLRRAKTHGKQRFGARGEPPSGERREEQRREEQEKMSVCAKKSYVCGAGRRAVLGDNGSHPSSRLSMSLSARVSLTLSGDGTVIGPILDDAIILTLPLGCVEVRRRRRKTKLDRPHLSSACVGSLATPAPCCCIFINNHIMSLDICAWVGERFTRKQIERLHAVQRAKRGGRESQGQMISTTVIFPGRL